LKLISKNILCIALFFCGNLLFAQNKTMDSLNALMNSAKQDSTRLQLYFKLLDACDISENVKYGEPAVKLCDKLIAQSKSEKEKNEFLRMKAKVLNFISFSYQDRKDIDIRIEYLKKIQEIYRQTKDTVAVLNMEFSIADLYRFAGNLPKTFEHYQKGLATSEKLHYKKGIARFLAQLGDMYSDQGDTTQAVQMYKRMLLIAEELKDRHFLAITTMKVGGLYNAMKHYNKALDYYKQSGSLFKEFDDIGGRMEVHKNTGDTYNEKGDLDNAIINYGIAVQLARQMEKPVAQINMMGRQALAYANKKDFKNAIAVIDSAFIVDKNNRSGGNMKGWLNFRLAKIYFKQGEFKKAKISSDISLQAILNSNGVEARRDAEQLAAIIDSANGDLRALIFIIFNISSIAIN
jgi:tetratricopeptide (TPR) repeat protein